MKRVFILLDFLTVLFLAADLCNKHWPPEHSQYEEDEAGNEISPKIAVFATGVCVPSAIRAESERD